MIQMNEPHADFLAIADAMDRLVERGRQPEIQEPLRQMESAANEIAKAWSGSWLGYHATVYYIGLRPRPPGAHFSQETGLTDRYLSDTTGEWLEFDPEAVEAAIHERAGNPDLGASHALREEAAREFEAHKLNALSVIETVGSSDNFLKRLGGDLDRLRILNRYDLLNAWRPSGQFVSSDMLALGQGLWNPPHFFCPRAGDRGSTGTRRRGESRQACETGGLPSLAYAAPGAAVRDRRDERLHRSRPLTDLA